MILDPDSVTKTEYLYGIEPKTLMTMNYKQAIEIKIKLAKVIISDLYIPHYTKRDEERIVKVHNSISFNKKLLEELDQ